MCQVSNVQLQDFLLYQGRIPTEDVWQTEDSATGMVFSPEGKDNSHGHTTKKYIATSWAMKTCAYSVVKSSGGHGKYSGATDNSTYTTEEHNTEINM